MSVVRRRDVSTLVVAFGSLYLFAAEPQQVPDLGPTQERTQELAWKAASLGDLQTPEQHEQQRMDEEQKREAEGAPAKLLEGIAEVSRAKDEQQAAGEEGPPPQTTELVVEDQLEAQIAGVKQEQEKDLAAHDQFVGQALESLRETSQGMPDREQFLNDFTEKAEAARAAKVAEQAAVIEAIREVPPPPPPPPLPAREF